MSATLRIQAGQATLTGRKQRNEDACGLLLPEETLCVAKGIAVVIADGMSGCAAGREASEACVQGFLNDYYSTPESWSVKSSAQKVLAALNRWLYGQGQRALVATYGWVTTFSALVLKSNTAYLFHVGDTRIYRLRGGDLEQLTKDHRFQADEDKVYLSRALGVDLHVDIDYRTVPLEAGDCFLLATDGVHEFMTDAALKSLLNADETEEATAQAIVQQALEQGSDDNLTCQVVRVIELPLQERGEFCQRLTELPFPPPLESGMVLDGYRVLRALHASKRTEVYLVQDTESGEKRVLKAPSVNYADDAEYINQFLHEEWAGRRIDNPHVLKVVESPRPRQFLYYLTEYLEGGTLRQWLADHPQPLLGQVRGIIEQLATGLRAFHRLEMIHQDLKPENIHIDEHGTVKIIDFGSVKIAGIEEIAAPLGADTPLATIDYAAPEYFRGEATTPRSDLYALGLIAYELLTGKLPYDRPPTVANLRWLRYRPARTLNPAVPLWLDRALEKAVSFDARRRYSESSEFIYDLGHPNPDFLGDDRAPLLERNPLAFWRGLALAALLLNLLLLYLLLR